MSQKFFILNSALLRKSKQTKLFDSKTDEVKAEQDREDANPSNAPEVYAPKVYSVLMSYSLPTLLISTTMPVPSHADLYAQIQALQKQLAKLQEAANAKETKTKNNDKPFVEASKFVHEYFVLNRRLTWVSPSATKPKYSL